MKTLLLLLVLTNGGIHTEQVVFYTKVDCERSMEKIIYDLEAEDTVVRGSCVRVTDPFK